MQVIQTNGWGGVPGRSDCACACVYMCTCVLRIREAATGSNLPRLTCSIDVVNMLADMLVVRVDTVCHQ